MAQPGDGGEGPAGIDSDIGAGNGEGAGGNIVPDQESIDSEGDSNTGSSSSESGDDSGIYLLTLLWSSQG